MKKNYTNYFLLSFLVFFNTLFHQAFGQPAPIINNIQGPSSVCSNPGSPRTYSVTANNSPNFYTWSYTGPSSGVIFSNPSGAVTTISFSYPSLNATYTISCFATNGGGVSAVKKLVVKVFETPNVTFSGSNFFCQGSSTNLSASPTILSSSSTLAYNWKPASGLSSTTGSTVNAQPSVTTNYTLLLTLGTCTNAVQLTIVPVTCIVGINSIGSLENDQLFVYPNPNNGSFILKAGKGGLVNILNEIGQSVRTFNLIAGEETKITDLPGGIYFVITPNSRKKIVVTN